MRSFAFRKASVFAVALTALFVLPAAYLLMGQPSSTGKDPAEALKRYLEAVYARDYRAAYQLISAKDRKHKSKEDYLRENPPFSGAALELTRKLAHMIELQEMQRENRGERAILRFKIRLPNANEPSLQKLFLDFDPERLARLTREEIEGIEKKLQLMKRQGTVPLIGGEDKAEMVKEQGGWKVLADWAGAVRVQFQAEVKEGLPWEFRPVQETVLANPGETLQAIYKVKNLSNRLVTAKARHIDEPKELAKEHLQIVQCFCFIQQTLAPGEERELSLIFRVNWDVPSDVREFRVIYEFYPIEKFPEK